MADKTLNTIIVLRNDKSTDWADSDVILREGELGVSYLDNGNVMVKAGNGKDVFADLPQVESVLESDMMLTYSFGKHTVPTGGSKNAGGTGMTMSQWIADALKKTVEPTIKRAPTAKGSRKVAVIGPEATPPESNAIEVNISGTKNVSTRAIAYPGIKNHIIDIPVRTRIIASPTETATPIESDVPRSFPGIVPEVVSSTCFVST